MSYPGGGYPGAGGAPPQGQGYPGQQQGYQQPGAPAAGGYPGGAGASAPPGQGYPGQQQGYRPPGGAPAPQQGGYGGAPPQQAPMGGAPAGGAYPGAPQGQVNPDVAAWFHAVDTDRSGQISASELQRALVNGNWSHFSEEACRMMIEMFDRDRTMTINLNEFNDLFNYINQWKSTFESIDRDRSGFIEFQELTQAFTQMGYRFSPTFTQNLLVKYDPRTRRLTLDNFIVSCVQIKRLTDSFRTRDREMRGTANMAYEDFVGLAIGCHK